MKKIGVFDSGVGGVSVLKEILKIYPKDHIIYFGDSLNAPYGVRPIEDIRSFCMDIAEFLISQNVEAIVIACNTATGAIYDILKEKLSIPVIGVVSAGAEAAMKITRNNHIGVMATPATVRMDVYAKSIKNILPQAEISQVGCAPFCPMVEAGWVDSKDNDQMIIDFLNELPKDIDTLVLGCTHYPFIRKYIERYYSGNIVDPSHQTALTLKRFIEPSMGKEEGKVEFFVSGDLKKFKDVAESFLEKPIEKIEQKILQA